MELSMALINKMKCTFIASVLSQSEEKNKKALSVLIRQKMNMLKHKSYLKLLT